MSAKIHEIKMTPKNTAAAIRMVAANLSDAFNPPPFSIEDAVMELGFLAECVETFQQAESALQAQKEDGKQ